MPLTSYCLITEVGLLQMSISLILIGVISLIVIAGTGYLLQSKSEQLTQKKKTNILLIVGAVIFASFIVTNIKHPIRSSGTQHQDLTHLFFKKDCNYGREFKYLPPVEVSEEIVNEVYARNYQSIHTRPQVEGESEDGQQENVLFLSRKDEGASHYLGGLAEKTCKEQRPTLYFKLQEDVDDEKQFVEAAGFHSYRQLKRSLCHLAGIEILQSRGGVEYISRGKNHKSPYIIIDNFEHLLGTLSLQTYYEFQEQEGEESARQREKYTTKERLLVKIINELMGSCKTNVILNTERQQAVEKLYKIWEEGRRVHEEFPFQFHEWQALRHYDVYKIVTKALPNSDYLISKALEVNKKEYQNFNSLFNLLKEVKQTLEVKDEKIAAKRIDESLRETNLKLSIAKYFGVTKTYKEVRSSQPKSISYIKQRVTLQELRKLSNLGLVSLRNGQVVIQ